MSTFLQEVITLLVHHFGVDRVGAALARVSSGVVEAPKRQAPRLSSRPESKSNLGVTSILEKLRQNDKHKHRMLTDFYIDLKARNVLPESQDIRQFAQLIGLKEINGKSRKDMIPTLMRFLLELPTERLHLEIKRAAGVSEQHRQQGFSVLTDKLLRDK